MRRLLLTAFAVFTSLFGAPASSKDRAIIVAATPTRAQWVAKLGKSLDNAIWYPTKIFGQDVTSGLVSVSFTTGDDGRPFRPTLVRSSHQRRFDRAALKAVASMKQLLPLPADVGKNHRILANIIFAGSPAEYQTQLWQLRAESRRITDSMGDRDTLVLNAVPHSTAGVTGSSR